MKFFSLATLSLISVLVLTVYYDDWLEPQYNPHLQEKEEGKDD